jgi:hypothetical protein
MQSSILPSSGQCLAEITMSALQEDVQTFLDDLIAQEAAPSYDYHETIEKSGGIPE